MTSARISFLFGSGAIVEDADDDDDDDDEGGAGCEVAGVDELLGGEGDRIVLEIGAGGGGGGRAAGANARKADTQPSFSCCVSDAIMYESERPRTQELHKFSHDAMAMVEYHVSPKRTYFRKRTRSVFVLRSHP